MSRYSSDMVAVVKKGFWGVRRGCGCERVEDVVIGLLSAIAGRGRNGGLVVAMCMVVDGWSRCCGSGWVCVWLVRWCVKRWM